MLFEPVRYSKFEPLKGSFSKKNLIITKSRKASTMRNVESTSGSAANQIGAEDGRTYFSKYFSIKSLAVLVCITVSLLVLPLVLPPLAPPPLLLLLVPIVIFVVLLVLALKYSSSPQVTVLHM
jgi:ABC-type transport system involved in cytochrome bd biosynthesis fused ATPase/permease subunit